MQGDIQRLQEILSQPCNIVITTHQKPDGDAMGSSLALYNYLIAKEHNVRVVLPTDYPNYFNWMPNTMEALVYEDFSQKILSDIAIEEADLIFCLDFNDLKRIEPVNEMIENYSNAEIVLIDHHLNPQDFADWTLHDTKASSTCELVYKFLHIIEPKITLTKEIAQCLYTGILTDTGGFSNGATNKTVFEITAKLIDCGLDILYVQSQMSQNGTENRLRFLGNALSKQMYIREDLGLGFIVVSKKDVYRYNLSTGDTEGIVNYPLSIKNIKVAVLLKEDNKIIKLSFRSKDEISVEKICRENFEGGGHRNASGGKSTLNMEDTIEKLISIFEKEKLV